MSNGAAHSLYLVIELNSNKRIKMIIGKFTVVSLLFFFSLKCHVCWTLVMKMTKVRKKLQISHGDVTCALCYFRHWF